MVMQDTLFGYHYLLIKWGRGLGAGGFQRVRKECGKGDNISNNGDLQRELVIFHTS